MNHSNNNSQRQSSESTNASTPSVLSPGEVRREEEEDGKIESTKMPSKPAGNGFIGIEELWKQFDDQLHLFEEWYERRDWLAFHHHHYDWWMFPIDEISSRGETYQLPYDVIDQLKRDDKFVELLRKGVRLMVSSWGWDIDQSKLFDKRDDKQKWSHWPVRLYKAGKCMWLFDQRDYYQSLKTFALEINKKEKLDYFSHTKKGKADVLEQWDRMERGERP